MSDVKMLTVRRYVKAPIRCSEDACRWGLDGVHDEESPQLEIPRCARCGCGFAKRKTVTRCVAPDGVEGGCWRQKGPVASVAETSKKAFIDWRQRRRAGSSAGKGARIDANHELRAGGEGYAVGDMLADEASPPRHFVVTAVGTGPIAEVGEWRAGDRAVARGRNADISTDGEVRAGGAGDAVGDIELSTDGTLHRVSAVDCDLVGRVWCHKEECQAAAVVAMGGDPEGAIEQDSALQAIDVTDECGACSGTLGWDNGVRQLPLDAPCARINKALVGLTSPWRLEARTLYSAF